jgi:hypothetical protein
VTPPINRVIESAKLTLGEFFPKQWDDQNLSSVSTSVGKRSKRKKPTRNARNDDESAKKGNVPPDGPNVIQPTTALEDRVEKDLALNKGKSKSSGARETSLSCDVFINNLEDETHGSTTTTNRISRPESQVDAVAPGTYRKDDPTTGTRIHQPTTEAWTKNKTWYRIRPWPFRLKPLLQYIETAIRWKPISAFNETILSFDATREAAARNLQVLEDNDFDLQKVIKRSGAKQG